MITIRAGAVELDGWKAKPPGGFVEVLRYRRVFLDLEVGLV